MHIMMKMCEVLLGKVTGSVGPTQRWAGEEEQSTGRTPAPAPGNPSAQRGQLLISLTSSQSTSKAVCRQHTLI